MPLSDTFSRANTTGPLGVADSGQTWTSFQMGIQGAGAYADARADSSLSDGTITMKVSAIDTASASQTFIIFRYVDGNNYWRVGLSNPGGFYQFERWVGGVYTWVDGATATANNGDVWTLEMFGSVLTFKLNGTTLVVVNDATHATATVHGFGMYQDGLTRVDEFSVVTGALQSSTASFASGAAIATVTARQAFASSAFTSSATMRGLDLSTIPRRGAGHLTGPTPSIVTPPASAVFTSGAAMSFVVGVAARIGQAAFLSGGSFWRIDLSFIPRTGAGRWIGPAADVVPQPNVATFTSVASMVVEGGPTRYADVAFASVAVLSATGGRGAISDATFTSKASFWRYDLSSVPRTGAGRLVGPNADIFVPPITLAFVSVATLAAAGVVEKLSAGAFASRATLIASGSALAQGQAEFVSRATLGARSDVVEAVSAFSAFASMVANGYVVKAGQTALSAAATLVAIGETSGTGSAAAFASRAAMTTTFLVSRSAVATFTSVVSLTATGATTALAQVAFASRAGMAAESAITSADATFTATSTLSAQGHVVKAGQAAFASVAVLVFVGETSGPGSVATFSSVAMVAATGEGLVVAQATFASGATLVVISGNFWVGIGPPAPAPVVIFGTATEEDMAGFSTVIANRLLNYAFRGVAPATIPGVVLSLHSADPGSGGANEFSGQGYTRQAPNFGAASAGSIALTDPVTFTALPPQWVMYIGAWTTDPVPQFISSIPNGDPKNFVAEADDDTFTSAGHGLSDGMAVALLAISGTSLPTGVSADTPYYVRDATANTFRLAATSGGAALAISSDGIGTVRRVQHMDTDDNFTVLAGSQFSFLGV
jgi:hypothetical protein